MSLSDRRMTDRRYELAGLLSTLDFRPSGEHPAELLPMVDQVIALLSEASHD